MAAVDGQAQTGGPGAPYPNEWSNKQPKARKGYVGLANQGSTCYMNSLLQALYMTPEFRQKLYLWKYDAEKHGEDKESIPLQL